MRSWAHIRWRSMALKEPALQYGHRTRVRVSVVGDFNAWDGRRHAMHRMPMSGIFELFIPGVKAGDIYKYELKLKGNRIELKSDPYAACTEVPPANASVVADTSVFQWEDEDLDEGA